MATSQRLSSSTSRLAKTTSAPSSSSSSLATSQNLSDRRLFVSNLAPPLTEHDLLRLFQPFGTIRKLDFIFHRSGAQKGKPKGYAFVEFSQKEESAKAKKALDGRLVKGREIRLSYATVNEGYDSGSGPHRRKRGEDLAKSTTLSLVKNLNSNDSTDARIAAMEAKLSSLKRRTESNANTTTTTTTSLPSHSPASLSPRHTLLPTKPRQ